MQPEEFYPRELTGASRVVLERFLSDFPDAILIGGWASWRRIGALPSHDIDVIAGPELLAPIGESYGPVTTSTHIGGKKWRAEHERIHFDIHVSYQSRLGRRLRLRVEDLLEHTEDVDGWRLLATPAHLATKFAALLDRPESQPGEKDRQEIRGLLSLEVSPQEVAVALRASESSSEQVRAEVREVFELMQDLELGREERHRLRELSATFVGAIERT